MVTATLNKPPTTLSMTWSSSSSLVFALFKAQYVCSFCIPKLNRSGSATIKLRYWSNNWAICSAVPFSAVCDAKSSRSGRGMEERKLM